MRILLVEDDPVQAEWIRMNLARVFGSEIERIYTESQFQASLSKIVARPPHIVIMDVMLSWAETSKSIPAMPDDVRQDGEYRAGLRCQELLGKSDGTRQVPVVLYSVQNVTDLGSDLDEMPENVLYLPKEADIGPLVDLIRELVRDGGGR